MRCMSSSPSAGGGRCSAAPTVRLSASWWACASRAKPSSGFSSSTRKSLKSNCSGCWEWCVLEEAEASAAAASSPTSASVAPVAAAAAAAEAVTAALGADGRRPVALLTVCATEAIRARPTEPERPVDPSRSSFPRVLLFLLSAFCLREDRGGTYARARRSYKCAALVTAKLPNSVFFRNHTKYLPKTNNRGCTTFYGRHPTKQCSCVRGCCVGKSILLEKAFLKGGEVQKGKSQLCLYLEEFCNYTHNSPNSRVYTTRMIPFSCADDSPKLRFRARIRLNFAQPSARQRWQLEGLAQTFLILS